MTEKKVSRFKDVHGYFKAWVVVTIILAVITGVCLLIAFPFVLIGGLGGADGHHACIVTSIEDQHNVTWDSTVVYTKTDPQASNQDTFCVTDPAVRAKLEAAVRSRARVILHYQNDLFMMRWECNGGDSIVVGVETEGTSAASTEVTP